VTVETARFQVQNIRTLSPFFKENASTIATPMFDSRWILRCRRPNKGRNDLDALLLRVAIDSQPLRIFLSSRTSWQEEIAAVEIESLVHPGKILFRLRGF
jgi:hypothetical protein